jgi:hypothetical protein
VTTVRKLADFEERLAMIEESHKSLADEFRAYCDATGIKTQTLTDAFDAFKTDVAGKLDNITIFVTGANTVFGLAKRHWRTGLIFGAGIMTSAGIGNPAVWNFIRSFAGG